MLRTSENQIEEVVFSFSYTSREKASRCNHKLNRLVQPVLIPSMESSFEYIHDSGIKLELDAVVVDIGRILEEDINDSFGDRIKNHLIQALTWELKKKIGEDISVSTLREGGGFAKLALLALESYFLKGYFPVWMDSSWDLAAILEELLLKSPADLGKLVKKSAQKGEFSKKRIAYLEGDFFDRIVRVLVPVDADYILMVRDSYLSIQSIEGEPTTSTKNLKRALNLFILNFIAQDSGPKFNRLSFTDYFLKSIASHFNLDFYLFLKEVSLIFRRYEAKNRVDKDLKEAITWVEKKNLEKSTEDPLENIPDVQALIHILNNSSNEKDFFPWIKHADQSGFLFGKLGSRYPGFWKSLTLKGLENLLKILVGNDYGEWLRIVQEILQSSDKVSTVKNPVSYKKLLIEVYDQTAKEEGLNLFVFSNRDDWYRMLVHIFLTKLKQEKKGLAIDSLHRLIQIGHNHGILQAPVLVRELVKRTHPVKAGYSKFKSFSTVGAKSNIVDESTELAIIENFRQRIAEQILWEYIRFGTLKNTFWEVNLSDLSVLLNQLIQTNPDHFIQLLKRIAPSEAQKAAQRLWPMIKVMGEEEFLTFLSKNAGPGTSRIIHLVQTIGPYLNYLPEEKANWYRLIWYSFAIEFSGGIQSKPFFFLNKVLGNYENSLSNFQSHEVNPIGSKIKWNKISDGLDRNKHFLIELAFGRATLKQKDTLLAIRILVEGPLAGRGRGLLSLSTMSTAELNRIILNIKLNHVALSPGSEFYQPRILSYLYQGFKHSSLSSEDYLKKAVFGFFKKDIELIFGFFADTSGYTLKNPALKRTALKRILILIQLSPQDAQRILRPYEHRLILILWEARQILTGQDWKGLSSFFSTYFSEQFRRFERSFEISKISDPKDADLFYRFLGLNRFGNAREDIRKAPRILDLVSSRGKNRYLNHFFPKLGFPPDLKMEILVLFNLPDRTFPSRTFLISWRKMILMGAFQVHAINPNPQQSQIRLFWELLSKQLLSFRNSMEGFNAAIHLSLESRELSSWGKASLRKLLGNFPDSAKGIDLLSTNLTARTTALLFLKREGYLPWWSPDKSKKRLLTHILDFLESTSQEDAAMLAYVFSGKGLHHLFSGYNKKELRILLNTISKNRFNYYLKELCLVLQEALQSHEMKESAEASPELNSSERNKSRYASLASLSNSERDGLIRKAIQVSDEIHLIRASFYADPRIQNQLFELLSLSPWMFGSNLNPGKWKFWLISYAVEFYFEKKNSFTRNFFRDFVRKLIRSQSSVNWKVIFLHYMEKSGFSDERLGGIKKEILTLFPLDHSPNQVELNIGDQVRISNAGLILCWPFLAVLFSRLGLSEGKTIPDHNQSKAVYLLQFIAFGRYNFPEYELVLNKLLIGMKDRQHLEETELSQTDMEMGESLLAGVKSNWEKMKNASLAAIRETFLQREGILEFGSDSHKLIISKTGVDILLDSITWNISLIRLPWMEKPLEVKWR